MASDIGMMIDGRYEVLAELGRGGMGVVYKAWDTKMERDVAIKVMTSHVSDKAEYRERFLREAKLVGKLKHDNIVGMYDWGEHNDALYMVMEYVEGKPLDKLIAAGAALSLVTKLDYVIQVCQALNYAHQFGLVHRDVKPANVMVVQNGQRVKLLDFGIARAGTASALSKSGLAMGTIYYMSPQQIRGDKNLDGRADIFAAGVMLFELLAGSLPWNGESEFEVMSKIINEPFPPLSAYISQVPHALDQILQKALAKDVESRYHSAEMMAAELAELQSPLKSEMVDEARVSLAGGDVLRAHQLVTDVLQVDTRHGDALELYSKLQQTGDVEQKIEQLKQLRSSAELALGQKRYQDALASIEQAISLHPTNSELLKYRDLIRNELKRRDDVHRRLELASRAQELNDYVSAQDLVEKALELDPTDTQARMMKSVLVRRLEQEERQKRLREWADETQRLLASRRYSDAHEIICNIEAADPSFSALTSLKRAAAEGQAQEQRRKEVETLVRELQQIVAGADVEAALAATEQALAKFPGDPSLTRLRRQAESKREANERERAILEQMAVLAKFREEGKLDDAVRVAEQAVRRFGADSRLRVAYDQLRDAAEREKGLLAEQQVLESARKAIRERHFDSAVRILSVAHADFPGAESITEALRAAREAAAKHAAEAARQGDVVESLRAMLAQEPHPEAQVRLAEEAVRSAPGNAALDKILQQVRAVQEQVNSALQQAQEHENAKRYPEALQEWERIRGICPQYPQLDWEIARLRDLAAREQGLHPEDARPGAPASATSMLDYGAAVAAATQPPYTEAPPPAIPAGSSSTAAAPKRAPIAAKKAGKPAAAQVEAPRPSPRVHEPAKPVASPVLPQEQRSHALLWVGIAAVVVIAVAVGVYFFTGKPATPASSANQPVANAPATTNKPVEPAPPVLGTVNVATSIDAVNIMVDGKLESVTTGRKATLKLVPGSHAIQAEKPGFESKSQTVQVAANSEAKVEFTLEKSAAAAAQPLPDPNLIVRSRPGATVLIDGREAGVTGPNGTFSSQFKPGRHKFEVSLNGYQPWSQARKAEKGDTVELSADLVAIPKPVPVIDSFQAEPNVVQQGQPATLHWNVRNATTVTVDGKPVQGNSLQVTPNATTTYALVANGDGGTARNAVTVTVAAAPKPSIAMFTLGSDKIQVGMSTKLIWDTQHASTVEINGEAVGPRGTKDINPTRDTSYTIKVNGPGGSDSRTLQLVVEAKPQPVAPPQPAAAIKTENPDIKAVREAVEVRWKDAYESMSTDEEKKVWPAIPKARLDADREVFRKFRAVRTQYQCAEPVITGNAAQITCTETIRYTDNNNKVQPPKSASLTYVLKKENGTWFLDGFKAR